MLVVATTVGEERREKLKEEWEASNDAATVWTVSMIGKWCIESHYGQQPANLDLPIAPCCMLSYRCIILDVILARDEKRDASQSTEEVRLSDMLHITKSEHSRCYSIDIYKKVVVIHASWKYQS